MEQYLLPKARNIRTGQTVKQQDLTGARFSLAQRSLCQEQAENLARRMSAKTGDTWTAFVETYTPTSRRS